MLETLIALFLSGVVMTVILKIYVTQHKNWTIQGEVTDMQQNARAAIDELTREIRMAGHKLPLGLAAIEAHNTNPDTIVITYADGGCEATTEEDMTNSSAELHVDSHDISCLQNGQWIYIFQPDSGGGEFFQITKVQVAPSHIQHNTMSLSKCYPEGSIVIALQRIKYFIDNTDSLHPNLMMQLPGQTPQIYAENIENLQFRYKVKNGTVVDVPAIAGDIREVSVLLTARTDKPDSDFSNDSYRHRMYTSKINVRNLSS